MLLVLTGVNASPSYGGNSPCVEWLGDATISLFCRNKSSMITEHGYRLDIMEKQGSQHPY